MKKIRLSIILVLLMFNCLYVTGQRLIVLENKVTTKRVRFYKNDLIEVKSKNLNRSYHGLIDAIKDSSIIVDGNIIPISDVGAVVIDRPKVKKMTMITGFSGLIHGSLGILNSLIEDETPVVSAPTAIGGGGLLGITAILYPFRQKKIKINRSWNMVIISLSN